MSTEDDELSAGLERREPAAWRLLYERHGPAMLRVALRLLGHRADAEDAVQEAFLRLYRSRARFRGRSSPATWMYRIVVNACLKKLRGRRQPELLESDESLSVPAHDPTLSEAESALEREVALLPARQKAAFTLCEIEGLEQVVAAEILEVRPGTLRYHLFEARRRLRERLAPYLEPRRSPPR